jgi:hypothetical protein
MQNKTKNTNDLTPELIEKIEMFESYVEGVITLRDMGRFWLVIVESNFINSINLYVCDDSFSETYIFWCDDGKLIQRANTAPCSGHQNFEEFVERVMDDIVGDDDY